MDSLAHAIDEVGYLVARCLAEPRQAGLALAPPTDLETLLGDRLPVTAGATPAWARRLDLETIDMVLVQLALAPHVAVRIAQSYALLRANPDRPSLSAGVALELLGALAPPASLWVLERLEPTGHLALSGAVQIEGIGLDATIRPAPRLLARVIGQPPMSRPSDRIDSLILSPDATAAADALLAEIEGTQGDDGAFLRLAIIAPDGNGGGLFARHVARRLGLAISVIDLGARRSRADAATPSIGTLRRPKLRPARRQGPLPLRPRQPPAAEKPPPHVAPRRPGTATARPSPRLRREDGEGTVALA